MLPPLIAGAGDFARCYTGEVKCAQVGFQEKETWKLSVCLKEEETKGFKISSSPIRCTGAGEKVLLSVTHPSRHRPCHVFATEHLQRFPPTGGGRAGVQGNVLMEVFICVSYQPVEMWTNRRTHRTTSRCSQTATFLSPV